MMEDTKNDPNYIFNNIPEVIQNIVHHLSPKHLTHFSSTNKKLRLQLLPTLIKSPLFCKSSHILQFKELFLPQYCQHVKTLFLLDQYFDGFVYSLFAVTMSILRECKDTLEKLCFCHLGTSLKIEIVKVLKEEKFGCLSAIKVGLMENEDEDEFWDKLIKDFPSTVTTFEVDKLPFGYLKHISNQITWIQDFKLNNIQYDGSLTETEMRNEVKFFLDQNPNLKSFQNMEYSWQEESCIINSLGWIILDECFSRGISTKQEFSEIVSWETFESVPESIGIERVKQIFHNNNWKIQGLRFVLVPVNRRQNTHLKPIVYNQLIEEFKISFLWVDLDYGWSRREQERNFFKFLTEDGNNQAIRKLNFFLRYMETDLSGIEKIISFLTGFNHLENITLNRNSLKLLESESYILPKISVTLNIYPSLLSLIKETELKVLSNIKKLHIHFISNKKNSHYSPIPFLEILEKIKSFFNDWNQYQYPIPHDIFLTGLSQKKCLDPLKPEDLKKYFSQELKLWNLDYDILIQVDNEKIINK